MMILDYTRSRGRQLTYRIRADERGGYTVCIGDKELMRGRDALAAGGRYREPNKRKTAGAVAQAKIAIEALSAMDEA
jgi:hypothetical protein